MSKNPALLVCPLDWGIGHATRSVPVIRKFLENGYDVTLAADGRALDFLKIEFPGLKTIRFPGTKVSYTASQNLSWKMLLLAPVLLYGVFKEHHQLRKLVLSEHPDLVLSDNRYGLWNKNVRCIFMTHQLNIIAPGIFKIFSGLINAILSCFIRRFDECWVPDFENHSCLAGQLSHPPKIPFPVYYIGPLSRFNPGEIASGHFSGKPLDFMALISGPEPQRTIFENILLQHLAGTGMTGTIVRGLPEGSKKWNLTENISVISHLETEKIEELILRSRIIICRPGYSSIMDLVTLGKKAILIPTPGQTEQEYLAKYLMDKKLFFSVLQSGFDLTRALEMSKDYPGMTMLNDLQILAERIKYFLKEKKVR